MKKLMMALALIGTMGALTACQAPKTADFDAKVYSPYQTEAFYADGKFDQAAAKQAYFDMMNRFNYPIFPVLKTDAFWVSDFSLGEFNRCGMGGIFWVNETTPSGGYLGHEIYLLPGQMIAEHYHTPTPKHPAKRESWLVRHGSCYSFSVQDVSQGQKPDFLPKSQLPTMTCNSWKLLKPGETDTLNKEGERHFLIAGPEGAIVTEIGTYHDVAKDANSPRFSNPKVSF